MNGALSTPQTLTIKIGSRYKKYWIEKDEK